MSAESLKIRIPQQIRKREREFLELEAAGMNTKTIATKLRISPKTVEYHRHTLEERSKLRTIAERTKLAIRIGLAEIDV